MSRTGRALSARSRSRSRSRIPSERRRALSACSRSGSPPVSNEDFDDIRIADDKATSWGKLIQSRMDYKLLAKYVLEKERENEKFKLFFELMFAHIADAMFRTARCRTDRSRSRVDVSHRPLLHRPLSQPYAGDPCNRQAMGGKHDDEDHGGKGGGKSDGKGHGGERGDGGGSDELTEACEAHREELGETEEEYDKFKLFYDSLLQKLRDELGLPALNAGVPL